MVYIIYSFPSDFQLVQSAHEAQKPVDLKLQVNKVLQRFDEQSAKLGIDPRDPDWAAKYIEHEDSKASKRNTIQSVILL